MKVEFLYRDAANYKTYFTHRVPKNTKLKIGDEIAMGEYETPSTDEFFNSDIHPHPYDPELDHNVLEVVAIKK